MKKQFFIVVAMSIAAVHFYAPTLNAQTNTARGFQALLSNTSGTYNTAMGFWTLRSNTSGTSNSGFGAQALFLNTTGGQNTGIGRFALYSNTSGGNNTASGVAALYFNTTGSNNTANGVNAQYSNTTGTQNTAIGSSALYSNRTGNQNTASGFAALFSNTSGFRNCAYGVSALASNTSGINNTAAGYSALNNNTTGQNNTATGYNALHDNTTGEENTASGTSALRNNTSGSSNSASGYQALFWNSTGNWNTATGHRALFLNSTGSRNTATGWEALLTNTTGTSNAASGNQALMSNTTGDYNTAMGADCLENNSTGEQNTGTGVLALAANTTGNYNTAHGMSALRDVKTGTHNAALGYYAGAYFNTTQSTFVGANSGATAHVYNSTALGHEAVVTAPNQVRLGNTAVSSIGGQVGWTTLSDGRVKQNVKEDVPGLEFINKLHPITYTLDVSRIENRLISDRKLAFDRLGENHSRPEPSADEQRSREERGKFVYTGFVAQEVEEIAAKLNYNFSGIDAPKNKEDFYGLRYAEFVVPLVKAVQELSSENEELRTEMNELKGMVLKMLSGKNTNTDNGNNPMSNLSGAYLEQNQPNPFRGTTILRYNLPEDASSAKIDIIGINGQLLKSISLTGRGKGQVTLTANTLAKGTYTCTLWVNNQKADSKQMIVK